jgi:hypothetical protein
MAKQAANVTSIDVVQRLRLALLAFQSDALAAVMNLQLEGRRPVAWIENDRGMYWPREGRRASDNLSEARINLERCEVTTSADDRRFCYDERKALERAKQRLRLCEEKVQLVRKWRVSIRKEVDEFQAQLAKMSRYLEHDVERAVAALGRMSAALERYVEQGRGATAAETPSQEVASIQSNASEGVGDNTP